MLSERHEEFGMLLQGLAESLDISDSQYVEAVKHYDAVGHWLDKEDSSVVMHCPAIYPQGSFRLGTMIKPINDADEYDIDLVCELTSLGKEEVSQRQLKNMVGDRLKQNERYRRMLKEGGRCWKLQYADSTRFHMDVLPAIPDKDVNGAAQMNDSNFTSKGILITDKDLNEWQISNPIGYSEWFKERMRVQFDASRRFLAESLRANVEDVPEYKVKTPLQRSIQILKRHRDIVFADDMEDRPVSIIISTLAAWAYKNDADLIQALQNIVQRIPDFIKRNEHGDALITNPVNPLENFADKWNDHPQRETKFRQWLQQVQMDLDDAVLTGSLPDMIERLKPRFGDRIINEAARKAFPTGYVSATTAASSTSVIISRPSKPWGYTTRD